MLILFVTAWYRGKEAHRPWIVQRPVVTAQKQRTVPARTRKGVNDLEKAKHT